LCCILHLLQQQQQHGTLPSEGAQGLLCCKHCDYMAGILLLCCIIAENVLLTNHNLCPVLP
jgi:hypothetical protein